MNEPMITNEAEHQTQRNLFRIIHIQLLYVVFGGADILLRTIQLLVHIHAFHCITCKLRSPTFISCFTSWRRTEDKCTANEIDITSSSSIDGSTPNWQSSLLPLHRYRFVYDTLRDRSCHSMRAANSIYLHFSFVRQTKPVFGAVHSSTCPSAAKNEFIFVPNNRIHCFVRG